MMGASLLSVAVIVGESPFHHAHAFGEQQGDDEVYEGDDRIGLEIVEGLRSEFAATAQQVGHGDDGDQRGILEHGDAFVADGRQDGTDGQREDNGRRGLVVVEAERTGGFGLSLGDGEDARAEDFAHVGAVAEADGDDRRHHGRDLNDAAEGVIDVKKLNEQRHAADDFHVGRCDQVDDGIAGQASETREQPDGQRAEQGENGHLKRDDQPVGKEFDDFQIGFRLRGAEGDECHHGNAERQCPSIEEPAIPWIRDLCALRNLNANVGSVVHKYS